MKFPALQEGNTLGSTVLCRINIHLTMIFRSLRFSTIHLVNTKTIDDLPRPSDLNPLWFLFLGLLEDRLYQRNITARCNLKMSIAKEVSNIPSEMLPRLSCTHVPRHWTTFVIWNVNVIAINSLFNSRCF